jgi:hypothetical protein
MEPLSPVKTTRFYRARDELQELAIGLQYDLSSIPIETLQAALHIFSHVISQDTPKTVFRTSRHLNLKKNAISDQNVVSLRLNNIFDNRNT